MASSRDLETRSVPRTNWSGNYRYATDRVFEPASIAEVQDAVRSVPRLRALGTRHSFNGIADSGVAQISTSRLNTVELRPELGTVRVGAGTRYGELAVQLDHAGYALHNLASLPHISVGGAVATGTHGSGLLNGNLATAVAGIELVTADGGVRTLSRTHDPESFPGAVVALGALGIVTHLSLQIEPCFQMIQTVYERLPFSVLEKNLHEIMTSGYSVSVFADWQGGRATQVWIKQRVDPNVLTQTPGRQFFGATQAKTKLHPLTGQPAAACTEQGNTPGPWFERLPHFRLDFTPSSGQELQSEYFVPFARGYDAIRAVEALRDRITPLLFISELRAVAADDLWLSMQYGGPKLALHFTWKPMWNEVLQLLPAIEAALAPFGARPHWGKVFTLSGEQIRSLYPRMNDFLVLRKDLDPHGKLRNQFLDTLLPG